VLRVAQERLDETTLAKALDRLRAADPDDEVGAAWVAVELLRRVSQVPERDTAHRRLVAFYEWIVEVDVPELTGLATTVDRWQDEVLAFFDTRATNAATESANVNSRPSDARPAGLQYRQRRRPGPAPRRPSQQLVEVGPWSADRAGHLRPQRVLPTELSEDTQDGQHDDALPF
jgi:hypothetical protein